MDIAYYMPFKPLGHPNPSGDLVLGTEIHDHLNQAGHQCQLVSTLRCRWIYLRPLQLLRLLAERRRLTQQLGSHRPDLWLSYHCYYKAPDLLGPWCAARLGIPYVVFQGIYSTKRRRQLIARPGFHLNRQALLAAAMVFTNKRRDEKNLLRLLEPERVRYIAPGIHTAAFTFDGPKRHHSRQNWRTAGEVVVLSAAMFRPGVKTEGLKTVIASCGELVRQGKNIRLVIAGDGRNRAELQRLGADLLGERIVFCGRIPRNQMAEIYSGADLFAFPGVDESLGMVYLEAQSCGLPVVAFGDWGGGEAVIPGKTGLLAKAAEPDSFTRAIASLVDNPELRQTLGRQGAQHVRANHELAVNYRTFSQTLEAIAGKR